MGDLILCYEKDCGADEKFSENPKQFLRNGGPHKGHNVAFFENLCEDFIQKFEQSMEEQNKNSLMNDVENMFDTFKKDILVKIDLYSQNLLMLIQTKAKDDKGLQLYLSVVHKDLKKIKECSSVFHMFHQPETIQDAQTKNLDEGNEYIKNSQNMMNDIMSRIDQMYEQQVLIKRGNEMEKEKYTNQLYLLQVKLQSIQNVPIIQVVEILEAQQRVIQLLSDLLIKYDNNTDLCICHTNKKLVQYIIQESFQQNKITSLQIFKETSDADFQKLIQKISKDSQQALDQNKISMNDHKVSLQKLKNELQASQQTLIERDKVINSLQASLTELKQNENKVVPSTKQLFSFSSQDKSIAYTITSSNIINKTGANANDFAVMVPALDLNQGKCVTFGFKIKKNHSNLAGIAVGMCHLDTIIQKEYSFSGYSLLGHGCYMVGNGGQAYSTIDSTINNQMKALFESKTDDTIFCTVNPTNETITFKNSSVYSFLWLKSGGSFVMKYRPTAQELHPCVLIYYTDDQLEFIQAE